MSWGSSARGRGWSWGALLLAGCAGGGSSLSAQPPPLNPDLVQRGAMVFMNPGTSGDGSRSCAGCHPGGGSSGEFYTAGTQVEPGSNGARRVPELRGLWQRSHYFWDGSLATLGAAIDHMLAVEMRGARLAPGDRRALEQYLLSIPPFDNGRVEPDGTPVEPVTMAARRGAAVFQKSGCADCHAPPLFARARPADVGTGGPYRVPSLRNLKAKKRYGHDGRWPDLPSAVRAELTQHRVELTPQQTHQLLRYLDLL